MMKSRLIIPLTLAFVLLAVVCTQFRMATWRNQNVIIWDVICYYSYLPALVGGDFSLDKPEINQSFDYRSRALDGPQGKKVIKTSCGIAVFYAPFFLAAYVADVADGAGVNTFTPRYHLAVSLAAILYLMAGLIFLALLLREHFSEWATAFSLLLIVLATNLFYYSTAEPGMSHVFSFFLFSLFLWITARWHESPNWGRSLVVGVVFGLIVLARPSNGLVGIVFLLYAFPKGLTQIKDRWISLLVAAMLAFLVFLPQMLYWRSVTGSWLYFSYADERVLLTKPHIVEGLFLFRKGWFIYTPLALIAIVGLFVPRMPKPWRPGMYVFLPLNIYLVLSWWCWWYGGSFGLRAFIESYALLSIPLAALIDSCLERGRLRAGGLSTVLALVLCLNLFQTYQYRMTLIHWDSMTWQAYKGVFLKLKFPADYATWLESPDYVAARDGR